MNQLDRRQFVTASAAVAAGTALAGTAAFADEAAAKIELPVDLTPADIAGSCVELEPITEFAEEATYDIVVVGAGCAGVPAVLTAVEEGASVACLQKQEIAMANGYGASCVVKEYSTPSGMQRWMQDWREANSDRIRRDLFQHHFDHSAETVSWVMQRAIQYGYEDITYKTSGSVVYEDGDVCAVAEISASLSNQVMLNVLAEAAEAQGAVFYYSTPAVQLVQDADKTVTAVIGKRADGTYIKVNATKGVILCAGDYMNNDGLMDHYSRDMCGKFHALTVERTGDGHILGILAGARMAPPCHAKSVHGVIPWFFKTPLLILDPQGERFMNEETKFTAWNSPLAEHYPKGEECVIYRIFDSEYDQKYTDPSMQPVIPHAMLDSCIDNDQPTSIYDFHKAFHRADTLEELCAEVGLPYEAAKKSIDRYNELVEQGHDDDFGVESWKLYKIETAPFYCIRDIPGIADINGGFTVDSNYQAVDSDGNVIPHLYGAGVDADNVCGGINWTMPGGFSNSHCFAGGRYTVLHALGKAEPTNPCTFAQVEDYFRDANGAFAWDDPETAIHAIDLW